MKLLRALFSSLVATALSGAFVLGGCGPVPATPLPDAGEPGPRRIGGSAALVFRDRAGTETRRPVDLHATFVSAIVLEQDDRFRTFPGVATSEGTFDLGEAGEGDYWLRLFDGPSGSDQYVWTDAEDFALEVPVAGRPDVVVAAKDTTLAFFDQLQGLAPYDYDDGFELVSANLGFRKSLLIASSPGETTLTASLPWKGQPLADAARGDDLLMVQLKHRNDPANGIGYFSPVKYLSFDGLTQADGELTTFAGTFSTPPDFEYPLAWKRSRFAALEDQVHPAAELADQRFRLVAQPGGADRGQLMAFPPVVMELDPGTLMDTGDLDTTFHLQNPYPENWLIGEYELGFAVTLEVPGDPEAPALIEFASVGVYTGRTPEPDHPVVPLISPPRALQIAGRDATHFQSGVGTTPTLTWTAPETGAPTGYALYLYEWDGIADRTASLVQRGVLMLPGDVTTVRLPPTLLRPDHQYTATLRAIHQDGQDVRKHGLYSEALEYGWADAATSSFEP